jgi:8-oxo-dGTP pyrophosphatase MutT (NUDIX family)
MSTLRPWSVLESHDVQDCAVFRVRRMLSRSPRTGSVHPFYGIDADDWVNVVPVTSDGHVVMVRQFRHGSRELTLEIPGGMVDPGETPAEAARRELVEETGYGGGDVVPIGVLNPNPALFGNRLHTFWARDVVRVGEIRNDGREETAVELVSLGTLPERVRTGDISHALVVAALHWFDLARNGAPPREQAGRSGRAAAEGRDRNG